MNLLKSKKFYFGLSLILLAVFLNFLSSYAISKYFPNRLPPEDLLFRLTPYIPWTQYLTDIANLFSPLLVIIYLLKYQKEKFPYVFALFAVAFLFRSVLILLNPFGGPLGNMMHYGLTAIHQHGEFPSGHTIIVTMSYLIVDKIKAPKIKLALLISLIVEIVALILSRGHFSIDIVGALLLTFFVFTVLKKYENRLTISRS